MEELKPPHKSYIDFYILNGVQIKSTLPLSEICLRINDFFDILKHNFNNSLLNFTKNKYTWYGNFYFTDEEWMFCNFEINIYSTKFLDKYNVEIKKTFWSDQALFTAIKIILEDKLRNAQTENGG